MEKLESISDTCDFVGYKTYIIIFIELILFYKNKFILRLHRGQALKHEDPCQKYSLKRKVFHLVGSQ